MLFTDFGWNGPYVGQMKAAIVKRAPEVPVIDLLHDAPAFDPKASAYLLPAYAACFPKGSVFLCVVDPGVGGTRDPLIVRADGRWFVGPGNGLFEIVRRRAAPSRQWIIEWRPEHLSASFHGRDLFAPVAAGLARGVMPAARILTADEQRHHDWPDDLAEVTYVDHYGNAVTGTRASRIGTDSSVTINGQTIDHARTFGDKEPGQAFWYANANGLLEISVNQGRAVDVLGAAVGTPILFC